MKIEKIKILKIEIQLGFEDAFELLPSVTEIDKSLIDDILSRFRKEMMMQLMALKDSN